MRRVICLSAFLAILAGCRRGETLAPDSQPDEARAEGFREILIDSSALESPWGKALGDIDGDGFVDALVGLNGGGVYWYRYPDWTRAAVGAAHGGDDLLAADVDGDGRTDVLTNGRAIVLYRNPLGAPAAASETAWPSVTLHGERGSHDLGVADFNADGKLDVAARVENGPTFIFLQESPTQWSPDQLRLGAAGTGMALEDLDDDGDVDVIGNGYWLEHPATLSEKWERRTFASWDRTSAVAVADINGDGRKDVFLAVGHGYGEVAWFEAPEDRRDRDWKAHPMGRAGYVHRIHLADMDDDGDQDVVFSEQREVKDRRVGYFRNEGGGLEWSVRVIANTGAHNLAMADVGADGDLDLLGADWIEDTRLKLWENLGGPGDAIDSAQ